MKEEIQKRVKTSIQIAEDLWRSIKIAAIKRGLTLTQVVDAALRKWLELEEKELKKREK